MLAAGLLSQSQLRLRSHASASTSAPEVKAWRPSRPVRRVSVRCFQQAQAATAAGPAAVVNRVRLSFTLPYRCSFGHEVLLVGSGDALGNWSVDAGRRMRWSDGDVWQVDFEVTAGPEVELEYKYVVRAQDGAIVGWKPGENCVIRVPVWLREEQAIAEGVLVRDAWDGSVQDIELEVTGAPSRGGPFTPGEEMAAVASAVDRALHELAGAMASHDTVQQRKQDPTAPEVLQADRLVAAAARKAVAMHRALEAARTLDALPAAGGSSSSSDDGDSDDLW